MSRVALRAAKEPEKHCGLGTCMDLKIQLKKHLSLNEQNLLDGQQSYGRKGRPAGVAGP